MERTQLGLRPDLSPDPRLARPERRVVYVVRGRRALWDRGPLPPGHALSWGAITAGTVLDDAAYPFPVFVW